MPSLPLIFIDGKYESSCGYCKHKKRLQPPLGEEITDAVVQVRRENFGVEAYFMTASIYDLLIQFNWRRCGSLYYKPLNEFMCCPQYAIRVSAKLFTITRPEHRRAIRKLSRFLQTGSTSSSTDASDNHSKLKMEEGINGNEIVERVRADIWRAIRDLSVEGQLPSEIIESFDGSSVKLFMKQTGKGDDCYACSIVLTLFGLMKKLGVSCRQSPRDIADQIASMLPPYKVETSVNGLMTFHFTLKNNKDDSISQSQSQSAPASTSGSKFKLTLTAEPSTFKDDEFALYSLYQQKIHKDPPAKVTKQGYMDFLCESSLVQESDESLTFNVDTVAENSQKPALRISHEGGRRWFANQSYHIRYEMVNVSTTERTLIAVSVVDALPTGLSSVYFIYHPDYGKLALGVLSGLIELQLMLQQIQSQTTSQQPKDLFYYLGFYIHDCSKMRYKAQFEPAELLCPISRKWTVLDTRLKSLLDCCKYCQFSVDGPADTATRDHLDLKSLLFLIDQKVLVKGEMLFQRYTITKEYLDRIEELRLICPKSLWDHVAIILLNYHLQPL